MRTYPRTRADRMFVGVIAVRPADAARMGALALVYLVAARLGLMLDAVSGFATLVWPPSGIALAALLLFGPRLWPGVFVGAFAVNAFVGAPPLVAAGIAIGNTLEALAGTFALRRVLGARVSLDRVRDVLAFIVLAGMLSTLISATIGVASLFGGGQVTSGALFETWRAWWIGDFMGDLLVAPVILLWSTSPRVTLRGRRLIEPIGLAAAVLVVSIVAFFEKPDVQPGVFAQTYMLFPALIWAALRFGPRGAVSATFVVSNVAIWGTVMQRGAFVRSSLHDSLLALQIFLSVVASTFLVLAATIAERRAAEQAASDARAAAEEANRSKAEFLAVMSHELRTPLNAIAGYVELLLLGTQGPLGEKQIEVLKRIQRNQQHLLALITDVLSFARVDAGRLSVESTAVRIADAIDAVEPLIEPELVRRQLRFERQAADGGLSARADPDKLQQILLNLLSNAVKFTEPGGRVAIGAESHDSRVRIWVEDSGIGIPDDELAHVFDAFVQVDRGTTRRYPGVGLGLTIARELARAMQGDVTLQSTVGVGTKACVDLPAA